ncbi:MAG: oxygenase MpaB family protein, partial [Actinomycetota bacterium]
TGQPYDALDPDLLLYVHACLVDSALLFERLTVGRLDDAGRERFHREQMLAAEMMLVPREKIPPTVPALRSWLADLERRGDLQVTPGARRVYDLFLDPPKEAEWRPILRGVSRLAFGTLPPRVREMYGVTMSPAKATAMRASFAAIRAGRPLLPARFRYLAPYNEWRMRERGIEPPADVARARRALGIRLGTPGS